MTGVSGARDLDELNSLQHGTFVALPYDLWNAVKRDSSPFVWDSFTEVPRNADDQLLLDELRAALVRFAEERRHARVHQIAEALQSGDVIGGEPEAAGSIRDRSAADRAFVLGAFARALPDLAEAARSPEQLVAVAARRVRVRDGDDVEDPIGASPEFYADCAEQIDELVTPVVAALAKLT